MGKLWNFFEELNEFVYAADTETHELVFMNRKLRDYCGITEDEYVGRKCYEFLRHSSSPCSTCNNSTLCEGKFSEYRSYDPVWGSNLSIKDTVVEEDGRRYRIEMAIDIGSQKNDTGTAKDDDDIEVLANVALRMALRQSDPEQSISVFLEYIGKILGGKRAYIFERNEQGNDDNTYEWTAQGVSPEIDTLQNVPAEVCANWYSEFSEGNIIIINDIEDIKDDEPQQYEILKRQSIRSLIVVPLYDDGSIIGFYGIDNPSGKYLDHASDMLQMVSYYIVASIRRRDLIVRLKSEEIKRTASIMQQEMLQTSALQTQENLDMVNDIIGSGLWYMEFDRKGEMTKVFWSDTFRKMLGFNDTGDFPNILKSWSDRLHPDDKEIVMKMYWEAISGKCEFKVKYRMMKKDGEFNWFHSSGRVSRQEDGTPRLFLGVFLDITKEQQKQQALEEAYHAANRANAAKTEFLANMSHDIRTPMNAIIGMTAIAATNIGDKEKVEHCLSEIMVSSKHLLGLINEVLDMNKIESGKVSLNIEEFDLADLVDSFVSISKPLVDAKHHKFILNIHDIQHEKVCGDSERIQQCLMNFMSNAVKYTPDGGIITLSISEKPTNRPKRGCFEFIFEDNGIGMSEEFFPMLFEPFARADDKRASGQQGTGLGMPITKSIIQMMSGDIKVESKLNVGSKFTATIFLELIDEDDQPLEEELLDLPVLVVDDSELSCYNTCMTLTSLGMRSEWVLSGKEAVEKVKERHERGDDYFAVIIDWQMPEMDGIDTTYALREAIGDEMPIIIISAYDWSDIESKAREAGVSAFLSKPTFKSRMAYVFRRLIGKAHDEVTTDSLEEFKKRDFSSKRVLVVEDNDINAEIAIEILGMTGLMLEQVWNGQEALDRLLEVEDGYFDLVFMDIQMPIMDGYEATRQIRSQKREYLKRLPIVAMSANAFAEDVQHSKESGMNDHVAKPLDFNRLMSVLHKWLNI